jgi:phosphoribosylanthranilate isomerase
MKAMVKPRVKICCISSIAEAQLAIAYGASAVGLVSQMPSGPGVIDEQLIVEIASHVPPPVATFLLTCAGSATEIIAQQHRTRVNTIQIVDRVPPSVYADLRRALPGISLVQVIHVVGSESIEESLRVASDVDAILLDSGNQSLPVKELGGTGRTHDWLLSRRIREAVPVPLFLAGGLRPDNIRAAIDAVGPFGVDICSGVRSDGKLDEVKLAQFFAAI